MEEGGNSADRIASAGGGASGVVTEIVEERVRGG